VQLYVRTAPRRPCLARARTHAGLPRARERRRRAGRDASVARYSEVGQRGSSCTHSENCDWSSSAMEGGEDVVTQLARLGVLRKDGVLSEDEFVTAKQRLLTTSPATVVALVAAPAPEPDVASPQNTSGWLWKKGGIRKKWERRWFVYRASQCRFEQSLHYYADDGCKNQKGSIDVWKSSYVSRATSCVQLARADRGDRIDDTTPRH
jgi:hypothetical protein